MTGHDCQVGDAEAWVIRTFARVLGSGALFFCVVLIPVVVVQSRALAPWYTLPAVVIVFAPLLALWPASYAPDLRWVRAFASLAAATYLVAMAGWLPALQGHIPATREIWMSAIPGLVGMAAAACWRPAPAVLYLAVSSVGAEVIRHVTRDGPTSTLLPEIFNVVMTNSMFVVATIAAVQSGRTLDRTRAAAMRQSAAAAAIAARDVERKRFDALIHDNVMSTLLGIARHGNTDQLGAQSGVALRELDRLRASDVTTEALDADAAVALIRSALMEVDQDGAVDVDLRIASPVTIPREACRAIASAAAEALRNSMQHADGANGTADRIVAVDVDTDGVQVLVADNGRGFDPDRVPPYGLGISVNIRARMAAVTGGSAEIHSAPHRGTRVVLRWTAPS
ncbi:sensor histidine kinase [Rhodococcus sp. NPDC127528]|uniref:sensor histidine kinase n=1 Tax=unclassified Rhodococcus (in: high G+C Gram-positive bacteria) TaxID=192944 RepID=UPI00363E0B5A